jgi:dipeptide/tripeptide permease
MNSFHDLSKKRMADPTPTKREILTGFSKTFWSAITMELFERLAYYGMFTVLALYLTVELKFSAEAMGSMMAVFTAVLYILPIFAGALADRYGYRLALIVAFAILTVGYFVTASVTSYWMVFSALMLVAIGGSIIKPTISGTVSHSTDTKSSSLGFGIYYLVVNIGGFCGPVIANYVRTHASFNIVFIVSASACLLMLLPALFFYKEVAGQTNAGSKRSIGRVFTDSLLVFKEIKFIVFLVIFSGYWAMFIQLYVTLPLFIEQFVDTTVILGRKIEPELFITVDAAMIIVFQIFVSMAVRKVKAITAMITGVFITAVSMCMLSVSSSAWVVLAAIIVFSIGEMTASPRFFEYVGRIAPRDKVALFLGYAFMPISIGNLLGGTLGGRLFGHFARDRGDPAYMWYAFAALGLVTGFALIVYDHFAARTNSETQSSSDHAR